MKLWNVGYQFLDLFEFSLLIKAAMIWSVVVDNICSITVVGIFWNKTKIVIKLFVNFFFILHQIHACVHDMVTFNSPACMFLTPN